MSHNDHATTRMASLSTPLASNGVRPYSGARVSESKVNGPRFAQVLNQTQANPVNLGSQGEEGWSKTLVAGDTLTGVIKQQAASQGVNLSASQAYALVAQLAKANGIANPDRVFAGQKIDLSSLQSPLQALGPAVSGNLQANANDKLEADAPMSVVEVTAERLPSTESYLKTLPTKAATAPSQTPNTATGPHPVLEKTLDRAVAKGFIPAVEKNDVHQKILELAKRHQFNPDDFAKMTLMESDGMNPRSTNQRCHGIIQFCSGGAQGAASAGFAAKPQAILGLSVYQQLHLVDKYFTDVGLKNKGPTGLDDLYLSVLTPNARNESRADVPLNIPGTQASQLHVGGDPAAPITRQSLLEGLQNHAAELLGLGSPSRSRVQAMRTAAYEDNASVALRQDLAAGNSAHY
jgi:hypothetical protein